MPLYLSCKREKFLKSLITVGVKLVKLKNGDFNLKNYLNSFVPLTGDVMSQITKKLSKSKLPLTQEHVQEEFVEFDALHSGLVKALKKEFEIFANDFNELLKKTDPDYSSSTDPFLASDMDPKKFFKRN